MNGTTVNDSPVNGTSEATGTPRLEPEFYGVEDAAAVLRISEREVYRLIDAGDLTTYPYKRRKLIDPDSVKRLADRIRSGEFAQVAA